MPQISVKSMISCFLDQPMNTIIKKADAENINIDVINEAGAIIKRGGLVAFPTETVYGLGGDALDEEAAAKIYEANKGRINIYHVCLDFDQLAWKNAAVNLPWTVVYDPAGERSDYVIKYNG